MPLTTEHHIQVEAPRSQLVGTVSMVDGWPVLYVGGAAQAAVQHQKYVSDYSRRSERPWKVGKAKYASLANALRALSLKA
jgi:hypothetical protein